MLEVTQMKKRWISLFVIVSAVLSGACVWAGTSDGFREFGLSDGEYVYGSTNVRAANMGSAAILTGEDGLWSRVEEWIAHMLERGRLKRRKPHRPSNSPSDDTSAGVITSGYYQYTVNKDGETITFVKYTGDEEVIEIPSEIDGYQVSQIGAEAFRYRKMKSLSVPAGVSCIGEQAFEYSTISEMIQLPENVIIKNDAFSYAVLPPELTIPAGSVVEKCAFSYCDTLENVFLESGTSLKSRAFGYCDKLEHVVCAGGSRLETEAFEYCRGLKKVFLCGEVETEEDSFYNCGTLYLTKTTEGEYEAVKRSALEESSDEYKAKEREPFDLEILGSPAEMDGVAVALEKAAAGRSDTGGFTYSFSGTIENNSDEGIMEVVYTLTFIDTAGEEFRSFAEVYDGEDTAIPPHGKIGFSHDDIRWGPQSVPASISLGIRDVKTETELPPAHVPREGDYLYQTLDDPKLANMKAEPPVELSFHVDQSGYGRTAVFRQGSGLDRAMELFCDIRIGEESGEWVTDNYNWINLTWEDGTNTIVSLNLNKLEYSVHSSLHTWNLEHLDEFWAYAAGYLEEDR